MSSSIPAASATSQLLENWRGLTGFVKYTIRNLLGFTVIGLLLAGQTPGKQIPTVVALCTDSLTSTNRSISGARSTIRDSEHSVSFKRIQLRPNDSDLADQIDSVRALKPDIILTVGSAATRLAKENFSQTPIVFAAVMYPVISGFVESLNRPGKLITGASLDIPADIQFKYFRRIIPNLKRVGVLYSANTAPLIPPARVVAARMGIELVAVQVQDQKDLPKALDSLGRSVDGLWSLADPNLFDPQSTKYILLNALRRGIPFMGFSRYVVESGALFALDFDYKAIGRQAGRIAHLILDGTEPSRIAISTPDIIWFHCNEKTAVHLQVDIPAELIAIAKEVYR
jgi:putative ABC transport system substrate-binding protein